MDSSIAYIFAIVFIVLALNIFFVVSRMRSGGRRKRMNRVAVEEAKQALWRDKEVARRVEREEEDALERYKLRNESLALYDEVRQRALARDTEGAKFVTTDWSNADHDDFESLR